MIPFFLLRDRHADKKVMRTSCNDHDLRCGPMHQKSSLLAQLVERETVNLEVNGSIPLQREITFANPVLHVVDSNSLKRKFCSIIIFTIFLIPIVCTLKLKTFKVLFDNI